jgi:hypothetical protein
VVSAGLASATAALLTSKFGLAGTLLGAALTTMIITGGSAVLKAYLENVTGHVRKMPRKLQAKADRRKTGDYTEPAALPERPDLGDNFAGRMRAALGWFSHLPPLTRRSILIKGLIAAAVAFVIGMGAVYALEKGIGNSLSCGLWGNCPAGATPGIHIGGGDRAGASSTINLGRAKTNVAPQSGIQHVPQKGTPNPVRQQDAGSQQNSGSWNQGTILQANPGSGSEQDSGVLPEEPVTPGPRQQTPQPQILSGGGAEVPSQQGVPSGAGQQPAPSQ